MRDHLGSTYQMLFSSLEISSYKASGYQHYDANRGIRCSEGVLVICENEICFKELM